MSTTLPLQWLALLKVCRLFEYFGLTKVLLSAKWYTPGAVLLQTHVPAVLPGLARAVATVGDNELRVAALHSLAVRLDPWLPHSCVRTFDLRV